MKKYSTKGLQIGWLLNIENRKPSNYLVCPVCKVEFKRRGLRKTLAKIICCSRKCKGETQKGKPTKGPTRFGIDIKCKICGALRYYPKSQVDGAKYCSRECRNKDNDFWNHTRGENHYNWMGGVTPINQIERRSARYGKWRFEVFIRDNFTCLQCGYRGNKLQAHHIKPWAKYKKLRFEIKNGKTLCKTCHKKNHE